MKDGIRDITSTKTTQAYLLFGICFVLAVYLGGLMQGVTSRLGLAATLVLLILAPALVFIRLKGVDIAEGLRLRPVRPSIVLSSCFLGLGTWGLGMTAARGLESLGLKTFSQGLDAGLDSPWGFAISLLVAAVGPGICEEAMFRGAIQGVLERKGKWVAVFVTAALFGLFHVSVGLVIPAALLGGVYGWVVTRTASIVPAMIAHFANNAAALSFLYFLRGDDPSWLMPSLLVVGVLAIAAIMRLSADEQSTLKASPLSHVPAALSIWGSLGCVLPLLLCAAVTMAGVSALPYFITIEKASDGKQIIFANRDSVFFEPMASQPGARIAYLQNGQVVVGTLIELNEDVARVRDSDEGELEIVFENIQGVLLTQ